MGLIHFPSSLSALLIPLSLDINEAQKSVSFIQICLTSYFLERNLLTLNWKSQKFLQVKPPKENANTTNGKANDEISSPSFENEIHFLTIN